MCQMTPNGLVEVAEFDTKDGIYDCAWSEVPLPSSSMCICSLVVAVIFLQRACLSLH